jgi:predicted PurR-regulated permease PerM
LRRRRGRIALRFIRVAKRHHRVYPLLLGIFVALLDLVPAVGSTIASVSS